MSGMKRAWAAIGVFCALGSGLAGSAAASAGGSDGQALSGRILVTLAAPEVPAPPSAAAPEGDPAGTIEVQATGSAEAPAVGLLLTFRLVEEGPEALPAARAFLAARVRVDKAFAELALPGLTVTGGGVGIEFLDEADDPFQGVQIVNGRRVEPETNRKVRFSERKGTPLYRSHLPEEKVASVLNHVGDGCGVRQTGRLVGVHRDTVMRYSRLAGDHAQQAHDERVAFSPPDP